MSRRPHVVLDALLVRERPTGVGRSILELVQALADRPRGLRFSVLATAPGMFDMLAGKEAWSVVPCPGAAGGTLRKALYTQMRLPRLVADLAGDLLHSLQFVTPLRLGVPRVVTVHDLAYRHFPGTIEQPRRAYYEALVPPSLRRAAAIVTNSQATADDVRATFPEVAHRVSVTPFGTPSWVWAALAGGGPVRDTAASGVPARPYLLFVGTLEPRKNLEGLLAAYGLFRRQATGRQGGDTPVPDLVLVGGRGWKDSRLRDLMTPLVAAGHLHVVDYCDTTRLFAYYRAARALLLPSLHEGFGFPILEAMAAGIPVLTSARGAMAEVAGSAAVLVDPDDPADIARGLAAVDRDPDTRRRCREDGPRRARQWTWARTADTTENVYREVLAGV